MSEVRATVREVDGKLVLDDPDALVMMRGIGKHNCRETLRMNADRVEHFVGRMTTLGKSSDDVVIVLLNVNDPHGGALAEILMPGHDWDAFRARGEVPYARGLASREGIQLGVEASDPEAGQQLRDLKGTAVVVMDHNVIAIFDAAERDK